MTPATVIYHSADCDGIFCCEIARLRTRITTFERALRDLGVDPASVKDYPR